MAANINNEFEKKKKKLLKELQDIAEIDEDSDYPIHEKFVKEKKIQSKG